MCVCGCLCVHKNYSLRYQGSQDKEIVSRDRDKGNVGWKSY